LSGTKTESEGESQSSLIPLEVLALRYAPAVAISKEHAHDLFPIIFHDKDEMTYREFKGRERTLDAKYGIRINWERYKEMKKPPLFVTDEGSSYVDDDATVQINRDYYEGEDFYNTPAYQQMFDVLVRKLRGEIEEETHPSFGLSVSELPISIRAFRALERSQILNIGDLVRHTSHDLMKYRSFGIACYREIVAGLDAKEIPHNFPPSPFR
jgi:hypothetical protein